MRNHVFLLSLLCGLLSACGPETREKSTKTEASSSTNKETFLDSLTQLGFSVMGNFAVKQLTENSEKLQRDKVYLVKKTPLITDDFFMNKTDSFLLMPCCNVQSEAVNHILRSAAIGDAFLYSDTEGLSNNLYQLEIRSVIEPEFTKEGIFLYRINKPEKDPEILEPHRHYGIKYAAILPTGELIDHNLNDLVTYQFGSKSLNVIEGMRLSLYKMNEGDKAIADLPASLAYGEYGYGPVPPNSRLLFYLYYKETITHK
ncbi:MAG: FKBP-type peptidyl-prolyl cis-trans isomerase [Luteibaculaceae bacterium]